MKRLECIALVLTLIRMSCVFSHYISDNDVIDMVETIEEKKFNDYVPRQTQYNPATDTRCSRCIANEKAERFFLEVFGYPLGPVELGDYAINNDQLYNSKLKNDNSHDDSVNRLDGRNEFPKSIENEDNSFNDDAPPQMHDVTDEKNENKEDDVGDDVGKEESIVVEDGETKSEGIITETGNYEIITETGNDENSENEELETNLEEFIRMNEEYLNKLRMEDKGTREKRDLFDMFLFDQNPEKLARFLNFYQKVLDKKRRKMALVSWTKETNLTSHNSKLAVETKIEFSNWILKWKKYASDQFTYSGLNCPQKRMLKYITKTDEPKSENLRIEKAQLSSRIKSIYSKAKVCNNDTGKCYKFEPGLKNIMAKSRNYSTLLWAWKNWRNAIGPKIRQDWIKIYKIANMGARQRGYSDLGQYWRSSYEVPHFNSTIMKLWDEIKPLYQQIHAYVRYRLHKQYGDKVNLTGPIPAHILGDMWAMSWTNIFEIVKPFQVDDFEVTRAMKEANYTVHKMFKLADQFYQSMDLPPMPKSFWDLSMFTRPANRSVVCYASAHNLQGTDVRIKMCAEVNDDYFYVVHHEMGHCQYYLAYNLHQPTLFQGGANSGFHEAIGDTAALSVISPSHLNKLGLIKTDRNLTSEAKQEQKINFLMKRALQKLVFYPFALTMDEWRWKVFNGEIHQSDLNQGWWDIRLKNQGIVPPIERTEHDFDPGSKFHITYSVPYIRYFISHILQFQFYENLCELSDHEGELYNCDFGGSKHAGKRFRHMLRLGDSEHWKDILSTLTDECTMKVSSMKKYFKPLTDWLETENKRLGQKIGWD